MTYFSLGPPKHRNGTKIIIDIFLKEVSTSQKGSSDVNTWKVFLSKPAGKKFTTTNS